MRISDWSSDVCSSDLVEVGAFTFIGADVEIGAGTRVGPHCSIHGPTRIGPDNRIHGHAAIGGDPQDKKYGGDPVDVEIGDGNVIRHFTTIHRRPGGGGGTPRTRAHNWPLGTPTVPPPTPLATT